MIKFVQSFSKSKICDRASQHRQNKSCELKANQAKQDYPSLAYHDKAKLNKPAKQSKAKQASKTKRAKQTKASKQRKAKQSKPNQTKSKANQASKQASKVNKTKVKQTSRHEG